MSNEEIGEAYRQRWAIEVLWKSLKMNLKLDKMMSKNLNGIKFEWNYHPNLCNFDSLFDIATVKSSTDLWK